MDSSYLKIRTCTFPSPFFWVYLGGSLYQNLIAHWKMSTSVFFSEFRWFPWWTMNPEDGVTCRFSRVRRQGATFLSHHCVSCSPCSCFDVFIPGFLTTVVYGFLPPSGCICQRTDLALTHVCIPAEFASIKSISAPSQRSALTQRMFPVLVIRSRCS